MYFWLGIFCLKQGFKSQRLSYTQILVEYPSLSLFSILFYHTNPSLPRTLPKSSPTSSSTLSWPSTSTCPSLYPSSSCTSRSSPLIGLSGWCDPVRGASFLLFPVPGCNLIRFEYYSRSLPKCANGRIWLGTRWEPLHGHFKDSDGWFHKQCA